MKPDKHFGRYRHSSTREVGYVIGIAGDHTDAKITLLVGTRKRRIKMSTLTRSWKFEES